MNRSVILSVNNVLVILACIDLSGVAIGVANFDCVILYAQIWLKEFNAVDGSFVEPNI